MRKEEREKGKLRGTGNAITLMLGGRAMSSLHDTPLQLPSWEGVNKQPCLCMQKTLLCRTTQFNNARTPSFQVPGPHPLLPKPWLLHTNVASTLPRPAKTATTLCQGRPIPAKAVTNLPATHLPTSLTRAHPPATHITCSSRDNYTAEILTVKQQLLYLRKLYALRIYHLNSAHPLRKRGSKA